MENQTGPSFARKSPSVPPNSLDGKRKLEKTQQQVNEVINIMHENVDQIVKRGDNLDVLSRRADELQNGAEAFKKTTYKIAAKEKRKQSKLLVILVSISILVVGASAGKKSFETSESNQLQIPVSCM